MITDNGLRIVFLSNGLKHSLLPENYGFEFESFLLSSVC